MALFSSFILSTLLIQLTDFAEKKDEQETKHRHRRGAHIQRQSLQYTIGES